MLSPHPTLASCFRWSRKGEEKCDLYPAKDVKGRKKPFTGGIKIGVAQGNTPTNGTVLDSEAALVLTVCLLNWSLASETDPLELHRVVIINLRCGPRKVIDCKNVC